MPVYEYKCTKCDHRISNRRPIVSRDDLMTCQECNARMDRILSGFSIGRYSKSSNRSENPNGPKNIQTANQFGGEAIRIEGGNCSVKNNSFQNLRTGISLAEGVNLDMSDNEFINVQNSIEVTNQ